MAVILNIETSGTACSVALTAEGMILHHLEDTEGMNQARLLSDFIKSCLDFAAEKEIKLDAVAVSLGPGSYTGLRIGLSEAKGLAYGLDIPLIGISTLELMATRVMFSTDTVDPESILVPMVDARRMEVYTAAYDFGLSELLKPGPKILDGESYQELLDLGRPVLFFGSGMAKWRDTFNLADKNDNAVFVDGVEPLAVDMIALAERDFNQRKFIDTAYSTPLYLKEFQATTPKNKVLNNEKN
ncbi:MAG: tRNA (adenosine(37)-N6)-threonylcarbamoyltransferase complex dimerization subunit type 1 TsaB [Bacteroidales bacterium]|nr:tRNA (adenosine(37)-N6)-threonylcarbamoyltransferase complex dimerization subunit type 1 TsaB [Bacteroidales bacterium]